MKVFLPMIPNVYSTFLYIFTRQKNCKNVKSGEQGLWFRFSEASAIFFWLIIVRGRKDGLGMGTREIYNT